MALAVSKRTYDCTGDHELANANYDRFLCAHECVFSSDVQEFDWTCSRDVLDGHPCAALEAGDVWVECPGVVVPSGACKTVPDSDTDTDAEGAP